MNTAPQTSGVFYYGVIYNDGVRIVTRNPSAVATVAVMPVVSPVSVDNIAGYRSAGVVTAIDAPPVATVVS